MEETTPRPAAAGPRPRPENLAERVYARIKDDIADFRLLPGDRFTESEVAARTGASRTPVRQALYRLEREGFLAVHFRSGWQVRPLDFDHFDALYDVRIIIEQAALRRLCDQAEPADSAALDSLKAAWLVPAEERLDDWQAVADLDEAFHNGLVAAVGNPELARIHREVTDKIRIIRRLDFTQEPRIAATYDEHGAILRAVLQRRAADAEYLIKAHIDLSKQEVRKITLHMLHMARRRD